MACRVGRHGLRPGSGVGRSGGINLGGRGRRRAGRGGRRIVAECVGSAAGGAGSGVRLRACGLGLRRIGGCSCCAGAAQTAHLPTSPGPRPSDAHQRRGDRHLPTLPQRLRTGTKPGHAVVLSHLPGIAYRLLRQSTHCLIQECVRQRGYLGTGGRRPGRKCVVFDGIFGARCAAVATGAGWLSPLQLGAARACRGRRARGAGGAPQGAWHRFGVRTLGGGMPSCVGADRPHLAAPEDPIARPCPSPLLRSNVPAVGSHGNSIANTRECLRVRRPRLFSAVATPSGFLAPKSDRPFVAPRQVESFTARSATTLGGAAALRVLRCA